MTNTESSRISFHLDIELKRLLLSHVIDQLDMSLHTFIAYSFKFDIKTLITLLNLDPKKSLLYLCLLI